MKLRQLLSDTTKKASGKVRKMWALGVLLILVFLTAVLSVPGQKISHWDRSTVVTDVCGVPLQGYLSKNEEWALKK